MHHKLTAAVLLSPDLFWPERSRLLPAECQFNPTITLWHGGLWMVYRRVTKTPGQTVLEWPRTLALCRLQPDLQPDPASNVDLSPRIADCVGARQWHADARFFMRGGQPWLSYHDNNDLFVLPLTPDDVPQRLEPRRLQLSDRRRRQRERNWGLFDDQDLKAVYSIHPKVTLLLEEDQHGFTATTLHEERSPIPWDIERWGEPHGGSSPVRVGDCWFSFFHASKATEADGTGRVYRVGFFGFAASFPHQIRYMTSEPLLSGDAITGERSFYDNYAVVYPSGAVYEGGRWLVSLGIHDRSIAFATLEHERLLASCLRL